MRGTPTLAVSKCRSCGAMIVWLKTTTGKNMPTDATQAAMHAGRMGGLFDPAVHQSHFATCPNADDHRKGKKDA